MSETQESFIEISRSFTERIGLNKGQRWYRFYYTRKEGKAAKQRVAASICRYVLEKAYEQPWFDSVGVDSLEATIDHAGEGTDNAYVRNFFNLSINPIPSKDEATRVIYRDIGDLLLDILANRTNMVNEAYLMTCLVFYCKMDRDEAYASITEMIREGMDV